MKRRILAIICMLAILTGALAVTTAAQQDTATFRVGYAKKDINPWVDPDDWTKGMLPIPLSGYGESYARLAQGWLDDNGDGVADNKDGLWTTCIAVTDDDDNTMLFISYDAINAVDSHVTAIRNSIVEALDGAVSHDEIMLSASHSHFSPDIGANTSLAEESMQEAAKNAIATWKQRVIDQMTAAAVEAMADRREASMVTKSETDGSDSAGYVLNGVRHYIITATNGNKSVSWYAGDNFGSMTDHGKKVGSGPYKGWTVTSVKHVSDANDKLYLLQFSFDDGSEPILLANWRGHTTLNRYSTNLRANPGVTEELTGFNCIGSDYPNAFRYQMEQKGYRVSFINGASGNINNRSRDTANRSTDWSTLYDSGKLVIDGKTVDNDAVNKGNAFGLLLSKVALEGLKEENLEVCEAGTIRNKQVRYGLEPHTFGEDLEGLVAACAAFRADPVASAGKGTFPYTYQHTDGKYYTLNSRFHVNTIESRSKNVSESIGKLELNAIMLGPDLAFVTGPGELYDYYDAAGSTAAKDNDWLTLISEQYGTPFVLGYSNGGHSYIPNSLAFTYNQFQRDKFGVGAYGANITQIAKGGGEAVIAEYAKMLDILNDDSTVKSYKCEHCNEVVDWEPLISSNNGDSYWYSGHYYLTEDIADAYTRVKSIPSGHTVCLDLNGHTLDMYQKGYGRAFVVSRDAELSIMDTVGGGAVIGQSNAASSNVSGGTVYVYAASSTAGQGILNLYGGTIGRRVAQDHSASYGGTIYCGGTFNMYGGTVNGGYATVNGGTVHMTSDSTLNMSGGTINMGVAEKSYDGLDVYRGKVNITGGTINGAANLDTKANISGKVKIENLRTSATRPLQIGTLEEGSSITVASVYTLGFFTNAAGAAPENAKYFSAASDSVIFSAEKGGLFAGDKWYCECGGTKPAGHTCENVAWKAWTSVTEFPTGNGNYYLTADVTTDEEKYITEYSHVRMDLNGHDITYVVPASKAPVLEDGAWKSSTRVIDIYRSADMVITDSTDDPGVISRDTSALTAEEISHITNWGMLVLINGKKNGVEQPASFTLYNGILDGTGSVSTGGGLVSVHNAESSFKMYGGTIKGGTTKYGSAVLAANGASAEFYGGTVTSGTASSGYGECVYAASGAEPVLLTGDADIEQIYFSASDTSESLKIQGAYTGTVELRFTKTASGKDIGSAVDADISEATMTCANDDDLEVIAENGELKLRTIDRTIGAVIPGTDSEQSFLTAQAAVDAYTEGWIILQKAATGTLTIPAGKTVYIDLNGRDLENVTVNGQLYIKDSKTDDYTVSDGNYGRITGTVTGTVEAVPVVNGVGYLKLKQTGGLSFHKLEMTFSGMALRPDEVGVYYLCSFLGDEVVKENVASYGVAMSTESMPGLVNGEFTADCECSSFTTFLSGSTGNSENSTLLKNIMNQANGTRVNKRNAAMTVNSSTYVRLKDGSTLLGQTVSYSLRDFILMADEDAVWQTLSDDAIADLVALYESYSSVMKYWDIPNLKAAAA